MPLSTLRGIESPAPLVHLRPYETEVTKKFRYDRRLRSNLEVKALVEKIWNEDNRCDVMQRISKCRKAITKWSKDQYLNSKKAIDELKLHLDSELSKPLAN